MKEAQRNAELLGLAKIFSVFSVMSKGGRFRVISALLMSVPPEEQRPILDAHDRNMRQFSLAPTCPDCGHGLLSGVDGGAECGECG
jgi:hypothetical protein